MPSVETSTASSVGSLLLLCQLFLWLVFPGMTLMQLRGPLRSILTRPFVLHCQEGLGP